MLKPNVRHIKIMVSTRNMLILKFDYIISKTAKKKLSKFQKWLRK